MEDDELSLEFIDELLSEPDPSKKMYPPILQTSKFVKWEDKDSRCVSRGCAAPTYLSVQGIPYCTLHTIQILADLLDEQINHFPNRSTEYEELLKKYDGTEVNRKILDAWMENIVLRKYEAEKRLLEEALNGDS